MPPVLQQACSYPGVLDFESASYSCTHSYTPGVITATTKLPPLTAAPFGEFFLTDSVNFLRLRDCKWQRQDTDFVPGSGNLFTMQFLDRRWRWNSCFISGTYNQKDSRGKLIPWMVKTPKELIELCLKQLGETNYEIDAPKGLTAAEVSKFLDDNPKPGDVVPPVGINPFVEWVDENAAVALAQLCDIIGRRFVFDPVKDRVVIARAGQGSALPTNEYLATIRYGVQSYATPEAIGVVGDRVKYQMRHILVPMAREHDGRIVPRDEVSYAPLKIRDAKSPWDYSFPGQHFDVRPTSRLDFNQARDLAIQSVGKYFRIADWDVSNGFGDVVLSAEQTGDVDRLPDGRKKIRVPGYGYVDRRQQLEITPYLVDLVKPEKPDPNNLGSNLLLPAQQRDFYDGYVREQSAKVYGSISRNCLGLWHTKRPDGKYNTPEGSLCPMPFTVDAENQMVIFTNPVYFAEQSVAFVGPFPIPYDLKFSAPRLVLETGVYVRHSVTNAFEKYRRWVDLQPKKRDKPAEVQVITVDLTNFALNTDRSVFATIPKPKTNIRTDDAPPRFTEWHGHTDDVRVGVIGRYKYDDVLDKHTLDTVENDPYKSRADEIADNYLVGHILEHQVEDGQTASYQGLQMISLDGAIANVTWSVAIGAGATTTASRNHTHGFMTLPYPAERKQENLQADAQRASLNLISDPRAFKNIQTAGLIAASVIK